MSTSNSNAYATRALHLDGGSAPCLATEARRRTVIMFAGPTLLRKLNGYLVVAVLVMMAWSLAGAPAFAQSPQRNDQTAALPQGNAHLQPFDALTYLIDESESLDPAKALSRRAEFQDLKSPWVDFGDQEGAVWLLVAVTNTSDRPGRWMIDVQRPFVDELLVQKFSAKTGPETLLAANRNTRFDERPIVSQYLVAPLWMEAGETAEILVGLRSSTGSWMPLTFATEERMRTAHMQEARFNWIINGALFALVVIALAMGRLVGWGLVLAFAMYASLSALFVANNEGYLHRFVWPESMGAYEPANLLLLCLMMPAALQFARLFSEASQHYPRFNRAVIILQVALVGLAFASAFLWQLDAMRWAVFLTVPFVAMAYVTITILAVRAKVLGAIPFVAGSLAILFTVAVMAAVLLAPGRYPLTVALDYFHISILFESLAFLVAILVRTLAIQKRLNLSLEAEVAATREKLSLSEALQKSRERYDTARTQAEGLRQRLASTSHDLQQPLLSLRRGLSDIAQRDPGAAQAMSAAIDYLQDVTDGGLQDYADKESGQSGEEPERGIEEFPVALVLSNCVRMFGADAQQRGISLKIRTCGASVRTEPIEFMRAITNLVSNALRHSGAKKVLLAAHERGGCVIVRVIDNGEGFDVDGSELENATGAGLGLAQVKAFASRPNHSVHIQSAPARGACVALSVPKA